MNLEYVPDVYVHQNDSFALLATFCLKTDMHNYEFLLYCSKLRYRSIITSLLHASPRVLPRTVCVEGAKIYRGKVHFHVMGRGFST